MKDFSLLIALASFIALLALNVVLGFPLLGIGALVILPWLAFRLAHFLYQRSRS